MSLFQEESERQVWARLNVHNTLLHVFYAEWLAQVPAEEAEQIAQRIKAALRSATAPADVDLDCVDSDALQMFRDAQDLSERFFERVLAHTGCAGTPS